MFLLIDSNLFFFSHWILEIFCKAVVKGILVTNLSSWDKGGHLLNPSHPDSGKEKISLNFYFHTSLSCLKKFYEGLKGLHKTFWDTTKCENKNFKLIFILIYFLKCTGREGLRFLTNFEKWSKTGIRACAHLMDTRLSVQNVRKSRSLRDMLMSRQKSVDHLRYRIL